MLLAGVGCAVVNRVDRIGLAEKVTYKDSHEGGEGLKGILGRERLGNAPGVTQLVNCKVGI